MTEDRYECLDMVLKARADGTSWFDYISDLITASCEGDPEVEGSCTCGLESLGGLSGTLDQCYDRLLNVAKNITPLMVAKVILGEPDERVLEWARNEVAFEERWESDKEEEEEGNESSE